MAAYLDDEEYFDQDLLVALANSLGSTVVTPDGKKVRNFFLISEGNVCLFEQRIHGSI